MKKIKNLPNIIFKKGEQLSNLLQLNDYFDYTSKYNYSETQLQNYDKRKFHKRNSKKIIISFDYNNIHISKYNKIIFKETEISLFTLFRILGELYVPETYFNNNFKS